MMALPKVPPHHLMATGQGKKLCIPGNSMSYGAKSGNVPGTKSNMHAVHGNKSPASNVPGTKSNMHPIHGKKK